VSRSARRPVPRGQSRLSVLRVTHASSSSNALSISSTAPASPTSTTPEPEAGTASRSLSARSVGSGSFSVGSPSCGPILAPRTDPTAKPPGVSRNPMSAPIRKPFAAPDSDACRVHPCRRNGLRTFLAGQDGRPRGTPHVQSAPASGSSCRSNRELRLTPRQRYPHRQTRQAQSPCAEADVSSGDSASPGLCDSEGPRGITQTG
jgi:hypothetical protein